MDQPKKLETCDNISADRVCLVTGATSGIGRVTARALAQQGATVIVGGRSRDKAEATVAAIRQETGNQRVDYVLADLSVQAEVRRLAAEVQTRYDRLDVLVNNAGGFFFKRLPSADGVEMTWALNVLGPFLLTNLLRETLEASAPARIVNISSDIHRNAKMNLDDVELAHSYSGQKAYGQSKLALVLVTYEWARRLADNGVTVNAVHPGFVATGIGLGDGILSKFMMPLMRRMALTPEEGAETSIYVASSIQLEGVTGKYFAKKEMIDSAPSTYDETAARRVWDICAGMVGMGL